MSFTTFKWSFTTSVNKAACYCASILISKCERRAGAMNKIAEKCSKAVAGLALAVTKQNVNSTCMFVMYQPELPENAKMLKKKK